MSDETQKEIPTEELNQALDILAKTEPIVPAEEVKDVPQDRRMGDRRSRGKNERKPRREPRAKPEFDQKIINIRRVTRVSSGGRRFSFSVSMVVGNHKGMVGVATGKASDTALAVEKAYRAAKKGAVKINLMEDMTLPHPVSGKFKGSVVHMLRAPGKGIVAGSSAKDVVELAGIKDVNAKLHSPSKNKLNIANATINALKTLRISKK